MSGNEREAQLYAAFLKAIRSVGVKNLKASSMFVRNVDETKVAEEEKAA